jgi:hypothetical protein
MRYYKDRDFPEIKKNIPGAPPEIFVVSSEDRHIHALLKEMNSVVNDYEWALASHRKIVREIDVMINGEEGAARQASLVDLVGQIQDLVNAEKMLND